MGPSCKVFLQVLVTVIDNLTWKPNLHRACPVKYGCGAEGNAQTQKIMKLGLAMPVDCCCQRIIHTKHPSCLGHSMTTMGWQADNECTTSGSIEGRGSLGVT
jgi:hypothetical protein